MSLQTRPCPAADAKHQKKEYNKGGLTKSQKLVYYWLLGHSNQSGGNCYIYHDKVNKAKIARECGIKSTVTITNSINKLLDIKTIVQDEFSEAYQLIRPDTYTVLDVEIIKFLLAFHEYFSSDIIVFYGILRKLYVIEEKDGITPAEYCRLMGYAQSNVNPAGVHLMMSFLKEAGLIQYNKLEYTTRFQEKSIKYYVTKVVSKAPANISTWFTEGDIDEDKVDQLWQKINQ